MTSTWERENHSWFANANLWLNGLGLVPAFAIVILFLKYHNDPADDPATRLLFGLSSVVFLLFFILPVFLVDLMRLGRSFDRRWGDPERLGVSRSILRLADGLIMVGSCTCGYWSCALWAYNGPTSAAPTDADQFLLAAFALITGGTVSNINDWLGRLVYTR